MVCMEKEFHLGCLVLYFGSRGLSVLAIMCALLGGQGSWVDVWV